MDQQAYLTVEEVAGRFGVTTTTIYRLVQQGRLPGFKVGNQWRFSHDMLKQWVADQVGNGRSSSKRSHTSLGS